MSRRDDHPDDMRRAPDLDDRLAEEILRGHLDALPARDVPVAEVLSSLREVGAGPPPEPSAALHRVFAEGIPPEDATEAPPHTGAVPSATPARGRLRRALPRLAGLGLAVKLALAGAAAAAAAAGGAGAAGVLPGQDGPPSFLPWHLEDADADDEADPGRERAEETPGRTRADEGPDVPGPAPAPGGDERGDPLRTADDAAPPSGTPPRDEPDDRADERGTEGRKQRDDAAPDEPADGPPTPEEPPAQRDAPAGTPAPEDEGTRDADDGAAHGTGDVPAPDPGADPSGSGGDGERAGASGGRHRAGGVAADSGPDAGP